MAERIPAGLRRGENRRFGLVVGTAFLALAGLLWWRDHDSAALVGGTLGGALLVAGVAFPGQLAPARRAWMALAHALSKVTTPVFLGAVYFLVFTPVGVVMRAFGRDPLRARPAGGGTWVPRHRGETGDLRRQF